MAYWGIFRTGDIFSHRAVGSFFMVERLSKNIGRHGWPTLKNWKKTNKQKKKKHWLAVLQKRNLDQNVNDLKFIFFWKYLYEYSIFIWVFFNFRFFSRKSQNQQKLPKKIIHFTIRFRSRHLSSLDIENNMSLQHSQKPFWIY